MNYLSGLFSSEKSILFGNNKFIFHNVVSTLESPLVQQCYPRRTQVYCVGTAKSGTHSIATMFDETVRSRHEPDDHEVINKILNVTAERINGRELRRYVCKRDRRLSLEIDSSQLNFFLLDILVNEFKQARFLLTIRDCYSWLDSFINDSLRRSTSKEWIVLRDLRFRKDTFTHLPAEQVLQENGLYTLDGYLSYWAMHNQKVLSTVPAERLLIIKTQEISQKIDEIAHFTSIKKENLKSERSHAFKNPNKLGLTH